MREIKFRAWDKETKEMIVWDKLIWNSQGLLNSLHNTGTPDHYGNWIAQQYTGLKDKNGVEIYEGDIVETLDELTKITDVKFIDGAFMPFDHSSPEIKSEESSVIGNIYENPELLEIA